MFNYIYLGFITPSDIYQAFTTKLKIVFTDIELKSMQDYFKFLSKKVNVIDFSKYLVEQMSFKK